MKLEGATKPYMSQNFCKICFKEIKDYSLFNLVNKRNLLCEECFSKFKSKFISFYLCNIKGTAIYEYDETLKELIYKYKGCYDYELKDIFLYRYINYLRIMYRGFYVVPAPSYHIDNLKRGFNHVEEIFKGLKLKMLPVLSKNVPHKQSSKSSKKRLNVHNVISIDKNINLKDKKILLVDDIFTTGSTLMTCIELLKGQGAKHIEILVIAKTKKKEKYEY